MVDQNEAYTFQKRGIFYFSKRVPSDLRELYKVGRLTYSLKTKCPKTAEKQVRDAIHKLEMYWNKVRMDKELPCSHFRIIIWYALPRMKHTGCVGSIFLECAADGMFTSLPIKFIIKTKLGRLYEHRNRP